MDSKAGEFNIKIILIISLSMVILIVFIIILLTLNNNHDSEVAEKAVEKQSKKTQQASEESPSQIFTKAISLKDESYCDNIIDPSISNECKSAVKASILREKGLKGCAELPNEQSQTICSDIYYIRKAKETKNSAFCDTVSLPKYKEECLSVSQQ